MTSWAGPIRPWATPVAAGTTAVVVGAPEWALRAAILGELQRSGCRVRTVDAPCAPGPGHDRPGGPSRAGATDPRALGHALEGVQWLVHVAHEQSPGSSGVAGLPANAAATRALWEHAAAAGVRRGVYVSSTRVYGLLAGRAGLVTEATPPRPIEPVGRALADGESRALEVGRALGIGTSVIRPVAAFGPGPRLPVDVRLANPGLASFLLGASAPSRPFNFVHAQDVARATVHLLAAPGVEGETFNVAVDEAITFEEARRTYMSLLRGLRADRLRVRAYAAAAVLLRVLPLRAFLAREARRHGFSAWRPEWYVLYSSAKLASTGFRYLWPDFESVLASCLEAGRSRHRQPPS